MKVSSGAAHHGPNRRDGWYAGDLESDHALGHDWLQVRMDARRPGADRLEWRRRRHRIRPRGHAPDHRYRLAHRPDGRHRELCRRRRPRREHQRPGHDLQHRVVHLDRGPDRMREHVYVSVGLYELGLDHLDQPGHRRDADTLDIVEHAQLHAAGDRDVRGVQYGENHVRLQRDVQSAGGRAQSVLLTSGPSRDDHWRPPPAGWALLILVPDSCPQRFPSSKSSSPRPTPPRAASALPARRTCSSSTARATPSGSAAIRTSPPDRARSCAARGAASRLSMPTTWARRGARWKRRPRSTTCARFSPRSPPSLFPGSHHFRAAPRGSSPMTGARCSSVSPRPATTTWRSTTSASASTTG